MEQHSPRPLPEQVELPKGASALEMLWDEGVTNLITTN